MAKRQIQKQLEKFDSLFSGSEVLPDGRQSLPIGQRQERPDQPDIPFSLSERIDAGFKSAEIEEPVSAISRINALEELQKNGKKLNPEELKGIFPDGEFEDDLTVRAAQFVIDNQRKQRQLQNIVNSGGAASGFGINLLSGAASFFTDPINIALAGATFGLSAIASGGIRAGTSLTRAAQLLRGNATRAFVSDLAIFGVANDLPRFAARDAFQEQFTAGDVAQEVLLSAVLGEGLSRGLGFGITKTADIINANTSNIRALKFLRRSNPESINDSLNLSADEVALGRRSSVDQRARALGEQTNIENPSFTRIADDNISDQTFFSPSNKGKLLTTSKNKAFISEDLGDGFILTDSPEIANIGAARSGNGTIREIAFNRNPNLLDLDNPLPLRLRELFRGLVNEISDQPAFKGLADNEILDLPFSDVLEGIRIADDIGLAPDGAINKVNEFLKENGFDGLRFNNSKVLGVDQPKQNGILVFSKDILSEVDSRRANPGLTTDIRKQRASEIQQEFIRKENEIDFDPEIDEIIRTQQNQPFIGDPEVNRLNARELELDNNFQALGDSISESQKSFLKEVREHKVRDKLIESAHRAAEICLGRG